MLSLSAWPKRVVLCASCIFWVAFSPSVPAQTATIEALGWHSSSHPGSRGASIAKNGLSIVGHSSVNAQDQQAFLWTRDGGMQNLGTLYGNTGYSFGTSISADGTVVVGYSWRPDGYRAFRLKQFDRMEDLGTIDISGTYSVAWATSSDGAVVVGEADDVGGVTRAFRWTQSGMRSLGTLGSPTSESVAYDVSDDGGTVVGYSRDLSGSFRAFIWTQRAGMESLGTIDNVSGVSVATGVTADAAFVVGWSTSASGDLHAFQWSRSDGMRDLGTNEDLPGDSVATCVTADGSRVGGDSVQGLAGGDACVWFNGEPVQLWKLLKHLDVRLSGWESLDSVTDITHSGRAMTGFGTYMGSEMAFRVWLPKTIPPIAEAGKNIIVTATSAQGKRVRLDGRSSHDPDGGSVSHVWASPGILFENRRLARPIATFPPGTTRVRLTATDDEGETDRDTLNVTVRFKNAAPRIQGAYANHAFACASIWAESAEMNPNAAVGYRAALYANQTGVSVGDLIQWDENCSPADARWGYAKLRNEQFQYGQEASQALLRAYAESGDEASLFAAYFAFAGVAFAEADLTK